MGRSPLVESKLELLLAIIWHDPVFRRRLLVSACRHPDVLRSVGQRLP